MSEDTSPGILEYSEDISTAEAPPPLPVGDYMGTIKEVRKMTSTAGNEYLAVTFHIGVDQFPADYDAENNPDGVTLVYRRLLTDDMPRPRHAMRKFCSAINVPMGRKIDTSEWIGREAKLTLSHDTYEGQTREQIRAVSAP